MVGLGYLGVLESLSKLETRYIKKLFGKRPSKRKNYTWTV